MSIESIADREDIVRAARAFVPELPPSLIGQWGVFFNEQLVKIKDQWTFTSRTRAFTKRRQFVEQQVQFDRFDYESQHWISVNVFETEVNLRIPVGPRDLGGYRRDILSILNENEIQDLFVVRQVTREDAQRHFEQQMREE